jgi:hypothetical protein
VGSDGDKPGVPGSTFPGDMQDLAFDTHSLDLLSESYAAVWRSDDGVSWMRVPHVDAFSEADGGAVMSDVALGESGLVAVGRSTVGPSRSLPTGWGSCRIWAEGIYRNPVM